LEKEEMPMRTVPQLLLCALFVTVLALVPHISVFAGQPVTQSLTPPPPPFFSCMATGSGTICRADTPFSYGPVDTGITCGSGAGAFDIFDTGVGVDERTRIYDQNGDLTERVVHTKYSFGQWSNPLTGAVVSYTQNNVETDVLAIPGDFTSATVTITGEDIYKAGNKAGNGAPVFIAAGRQVFNFDMSELYSSAGRNGFIAAFFQGDTHAFDAVCAVLGAS
jgi:hypothetical protein